MAPSTAHLSCRAVVICTQGEVPTALTEHAAWVVVVRGTVPEDLSRVLDRGVDADVITISRSSALARVRPDVVCWRRDHLAAVLATATSVPSSFTLLRRAGRTGARILDISAATSAQLSFPLWADAVQR